MARQEGLRQRTMRFAQLAYLFVLGWWQHPQAGPSALARFGGSLDLTLCKQEVDAHFTEATARWLLALLRRAVCVLICARQGVRLSLLQQFTAVLVEDGSTITLPEVLKQVWRGCGGSGSTAGQERQTEAAAQREARYREYARAHGKPVNPLVVELTHWTLVVTNVPAAMLSLEQAFALLRARWQIELLFKLWKEQALVDQWSGSKPARVLCEVYAKLLAMVVQHWVLLLACWDDPHRSLSGVAEIVREQLPLLVHGLAGHYPLQRGLRLLINSVKGGCSIAARRTRPSTSRRLQCAGATA